MTFTTRIKEEVTRTLLSPIELLVELSAFIRYSGQIKKNKITLVMENGSVARRIYKDIKSNFGINIKIIIRNQKRFRAKQIYILEITEKVDMILENLNILKDNHKTLPEEYFLSTEDEKIAFLRGAFLACGSLSDPKTSGYHLEFTSSTKKEGLFIANILKEFNINAKVLKRNNHYMTYVKSAEMISNLIRRIGATSCYLEFEDIRIRRDYTNMVNRFNNCEIANQERVFKTGLKQLKDIAYIKEHDLLGLLDEKVQEAIKYREAYPETSLKELAEIISSETGHEIGKSGINHYFIKVKKLVEKHKTQNSHNDI